MRAITGAAARQVVANPGDEDNQQHDSAPHLAVVTGISKTTKATTRGSDAPPDFRAPNDIADTEDRTVLCPRREEHRRQDQASREQQRIHAFEPLHDKAKPGLGGRSDGNLGGYLLAWP